MSWLRAARCGADNRPLERTFCTNESTVANTARLLRRGADLGIPTRSASEVRQHPSLALRVGISTPAARLIDKSNFGDQRQVVAEVEIQTANPAHGERVADVSAAESVNTDGERALERDRGSGSVDQAR